MNASCEFTQCIRCDNFWHSCGELDISDHDATDYYYCAYCGHSQICLYSGCGRYLWET